MRAASVLRSIADDRARPPHTPSTNWRRHLVVAAAVLVVAGGLGWFVARSSGQRLAGQELSGLDPRDEIQVLLAQARALSLEDPAQAAAIYGEVIERDPDHVEALTYYGWTTALTAATTSDSQAAGDLLLDAVTQLSRATELDPIVPRSVLLSRDRRVPLPRRGGGGVAERRQVPRRRAARRRARPGRGPPRSDRGGHRRRLRTPPSHAGCADSPVS